MTEWPLRRLGEVCRVIGGGTPSRASRTFYSGTIPWATVGDLQSDVVVDTASHITDEAVRRSSTNVVPSGNVVLATRVGLGKVCLLGADMAINQDLRGVIPLNSRRLSSRFLFWWFRSIADSVVKAGTGATVQGVNLSFVRGLTIPLPSLSEQQRIVTVLEDAFEGIGKAKASAEESCSRASEVLQRQRESLLLHSDEGWETTPLADLCDVKHGFAFSGEFFAEDGEYVLLTPGNFHESGGYRDRASKQKYYVGEIPQGYLLSKGDLLVAMTEQAAGLLGSPMLVPEGGRFLHNQRLGLVLSRSGVPWLNEFFFHIFNTRALRAALEHTASGVKVRHTSPTKIGEVIVRYPVSISEQRRIAGLLSMAEAETNRLQSLYRRKLALLEELKVSILHEAFSGNL